MSNVGKAKKSLSFYFLNKKAAKFLETIGTYTCTENTVTDKTGFFEDRVGLSDYGVTKMSRLN